MASEYDPELWEPDGQEPGPPEDGEDGPFSQGGGSRKRRAPYKWSPRKIRIVTNMKQEHPNLNRWGGASAALSELRQRVDQHNEQGCRPGEEPISLEGLDAARLKTKFQAIKIPAQQPQQRPWPSSMAPNASGRNAVFSGSQRAPSSCQQVPCSSEGQQQQPCSTMRQQPTCDIITTGESG